MTFNGVTFNHLFWAGKTLREFIKHESHHDLTIEQLEEAFFIINPGAKANVNGNDKPSSAKGKKNEHTESD